MVRISVKVEPIYSDWGFRGIDGVGHVGSVNRCSISRTTEIAKQNKKPPPMGFALATSSVSFQPSSHSCMFMKITKLAQSSLRICKRHITFISVEFTKRKGIWQKTKFIFLNFLRTSVFFMGPLISTVLDFLWRSSWVSKPHCAFRRVVWNDTQ